MANLRTFIYPGVAISSNGLATEANQVLIIQELQDINAELDSQTTGLAQEVTLQAVETELQTLNAVDFATETTLQAVDTSMQAVESAINSQTADIASIETNTANTVTELQSVDAELVVANSHLSDIDAELVAANTFLSSISTTSGEASTNTLGILSEVTSIDSKTPNLGQALMAASVPVVLASNQSSVPVSIGGAVPLPTGAATETTLSNVSSVLGTVNDAPVTDPTASNTSIAKLFRGFYQDFQSLVSTLITNIDLNLTTISSQLPNSLGSKTSANSLAVVVASDQVLGIKTTGKSVPNTSRLDYSLSTVTTGAWTELLASTSSNITEIEIFDSSGQTMELGIGLAPSEARLILVMPGGNGRVPAAIASGARVSIRAVSGTANVGEISINYYN